MSELIAGRYELKDLVGSGGMSSVYCAFDTLLERNVALKILHDHFTADEDHVERFRREARAVAQLSHPNIVTVIDRGERDGKQFIVFELVDGENLKELVERGGPLPVRRALELGLEVAHALAFAHGQGLVHRDVKPHNVLLDSDGRAKVTDFGIARTPDAVGNTETGTVLGTSHYIAPEQARGERVDAQTDVYSFGVVLYELLTGDVPYLGDSFLSVAMKHINEAVPSVLERRADTPLRFASLIEHCMAKLPAERPTMDAVVEELESVLAELDTKDGGEGTMIMKRPSAAAARPRRERPRRPVVPLALILLGVLLVVGIVAGLLLLRDGGDRAATASGLELSGVGAYDPDGRDGEHDDEAGFATDDDPATFWRTSSYRSQLSAFKSGVGLVLEATGEPERVALTTDTPGFTAEIQAGSSLEGPFETVSESKLVGPSTTWELRQADARYYVVWITQLVGSAHINEAKAS